jgi:Niemann-Pick C1 protein
MGMYVHCAYVQFWKMDVDIYEKGEPPYGIKLSPDFCFSHWQTQCRSTFEAPMDPHVIMGGFPNGPDFRNFSADSTAFVVTFPVDSSSANRCCLAQLQPSVGPHAGVERI